MSLVFATIRTRDKFIFSVKAEILKSEVLLQRRWKGILALYHVKDHFDLDDVVVSMFRSPEFQLTRPSRKAGSSIPSFCL